MFRSLVVRCTFFLAFFLPVFADTFRLPTPPAPTANAAHPLGPAFAALTQNDTATARLELNKVLASKPNLGAAHELDGILRVNSGDLRGGESALRRALTLDPKLPLIRSLLGRVCFENRDYACAATILQQQLRLAPDDRIAHLFLGRLADARDDIQMAITHFYKILPAADPDSYDALLKLVELHLRKGDIARAGHRLAECHAVCQERTAYPYVKAMYLRNAGRPAEAETLLTELTTRQPDAAEAWIQLGEVRRQLGKAKAAEEAFQQAGKSGVLGLALAKADQQNPAAAIRILQEEIRSTNSPNGYIVLAELQASTGDAAGSRATLEAFTRAHPSHEQGHLLLGLWYMSQKQPAQAKPYFETALKLNPASAQAAIHLANIASVDHQMRDAELILRNALAASPNNPDLLLQIAGIHEHNDDWKAVVDTYRELLRVRPDNLSAKNNMALALVRSGGDLGEAETLARQAHTALKRSAHPAATLGWVLVNRGNLQEGTSLLESAGATLKDNPEVQFFLSEAYKRQGRTADAAKHLALARQWGLPADYTIQASPAAVNAGLFACPMHPAIQAKTAAACSKCGMKLIALGSITGKYTIDIRPSGGRIVPGEPATLEFRVKEPNTGKAVRDFEMIHDRPFHFYMVSSDLTTFLHDHPQVGQDGVLRLKVVFPKAGSYRLISDFYPRNGSPQLLTKQLLTTGATAAASARLQPDLTPKTGANLGVSLRTEPAKPVSGQNTRLIFSLENGAGLEQYLGAWGHMLVVSSDGLDTIHGHPSAFQPGKQVEFDVTMPRKRDYKVWVQFQKAGKVNTVAFVLPVL